MCGITGIVSRSGVTALLPRLQTATQRLRHRGPESETLWTAPSDVAAFGHCRLCIVDLTAAAAQPMHLQRYTLVFNGEIYNYPELRQTLAAAGQVFRSQSDTEVLLAAYATWGAGCLQRFDGAFAFAIWDEEEQTLFAARDRFGEKPFFFCVEDERLVFASEQKALWPMGVKKAVNTALLYNFLTIGYTTNPADGTETFYEGVYKLPAAHSLTYRAATHEVQTHRYWAVEPQVTAAITEGEAVEQFTLLFRQSIRRRLRSDVPIGTSLSGGLDSSSIVAFCHQETAAQYTHQCFTASFAGFEKDETSLAARVAQHFGLTHHTTAISTADVPGLMEAVAAAQDEPFLSASVLAQYKVFEAAKATGVTVLLDGQGADEVLGGYHKYYRWWWQQLYRERRLHASKELAAARALGVQERFGPTHKLAALLPEFSAALLQTQKSRQAFRHPGLHRDFAFAHKRHLYYTTPTQPDLNGALYYNSFGNGLEELLRYADRNSAAHAVEVRLPFLQHELVEFLFTLPPQLKIHQGFTKWLLRKAVEERLPAEVVWRRDKVGYEPPQKQWMQNKAVQEKINAAKETLVRERVLRSEVLQQPILPTAAHEASGNDWRYWSAAVLFT